MILTVIQLMALASTAPASTAEAPAVSQARPAGEVSKETAEEAKKRRLICKRQSRIGSLVASTRVCLTAAEWELSYQRGQEAARGAVDSCGTRGSGALVPCVDWTDPLKNPQMTPN